jgi:hypothetical protein
MPSAGEAAAAAASLTLSHQQQNLWQPSPAACVGLDVGQERSAGAAASGATAPEMHAVVFMSNFTGHVSFAVCPDASVHILRGEAA